MNAEAFPRLIRAIHEQHLTWDGRTALLCVDAHSQSRIGTELDSLAAADFRVLAARFPNVTWAPSWESR